MNCKRRSLIRPEKQCCVMFGVCATGVTTHSSLQPPNTSHSTFRAGLLLIPISRLRKSRIKSPLRVKLSLRWTSNPHLHQPKVLGHCGSNYYLRSSIQIVTQLDLTYLTFCPKETVHSQVYSGRDVHKTEIACIQSVPTSPRV
jgi:hypothetical protein